MKNHKFIKKNKQTNPMAVIYKQKCARCKKNYVMATWRQPFLTCYDCQKTELEQEVKDPEMKKFFNIPHEYYKESAFLRNIKITYLRYSSLTDKQREAFKKTVTVLKEGPKKKEKESK